MTPPLFLIDHLPIVDIVLLAGDEGRHAMQVVRLREGERLLLSDGRGGLCECTVRERRSDGLILRVDRRSEVEQPRPRLSVVQALPKGDRGELAVETMTEVGVDQIIPWQAARCVTQWIGERGERARAKWQRTAREAAKQSRRAYIPTVTKLIGSNDLASLVVANSTFVLDESAKQSLADVALPDVDRHLLIVGPEGGLDDGELGAFTDAGAAVVRMGPTVMRTSTAGAAAVTALSLRLGRWS